MRAAVTALLTLAALAAPLATAGCSAAGDEDGAKASTLRRYAALGDSFTAGSGLAQKVTAAGGCQQSRLNYPHLVAAELGLELTDASCGGATTEQGAGPQHREGEADWPPQLSAVDRRTDLVTVGLGYNDASFYATTIFGCSQLAVSDPSGAPCQAASASTLEPVPDQTRVRLVALLAAIRQAAPSARVLVVGYPQLVPESGTCPELGLAEGDYPFVRGLMTDLDDALRAAAEEAEATFVDVLAASEGHDVCAGDDAWVNGSAGTAEQRAPWHPLAEGQAAVARLVLDALG